MGYGRSLINSNGHQDARLTELLISGAPEELPCEPACSTSMLMLSKATRPADQRDSIGAP